MQPYQERILIEKTELENKVKLLSEYINTKAFNKLNYENKHLLLVQLKAMYQYLHALISRILLF